MPAAIVRPIGALQAVHTSDDDFTEVLKGWLVAADIPEDRIDVFVTDLTGQLATKFGKDKPWLVNHPEGLAVVPAAQFANEYEDVNATSFLDDVWVERTNQIAKYAPEHDDVQGLAHLFRETVARLQQIPTGDDEALKHQIIVAAALLNAMHDLITRGESKTRSVPAIYLEADLKRYESVWIDRVAEYVAYMHDFEAELADDADSAVQRAYNAFQSIFKVTAN